MSTLESNAVLISGVFLGFMSYCFSGINWQVSHTQVLGLLTNIGPPTFLPEHMMRGQLGIRSNTRCTSTSVLLSYLVLIPT